MIPAPERTLTRIESKVNLIARATAFILMIAVGFAVYFIVGDDPWAVYYAVGAGFLAGFGFERSVVRLDSVLQSGDEE